MYHFILTSLVSDEKSTICFTSKGKVSFLFGRFEGIFVAFTFQKFNFCILIWNSLVLAYLGFPQPLETVGLCIFTSFRHFQPLFLWRLFQFHCLSLFLEFGDRNVALLYYPISIWNNFFPVFSLLLRLHKFYCSVLESTCSILFHLHSASEPTTSAFSVDTVFFSSVILMCFFKISFISLLRFCLSFVPTKFIMASWNIFIIMVALKFLSNNPNICFFLALQSVDFFSYMWLSWYHEWFFCILASLEVILWDSGSYFLIFF